MTTPNADAKKDEPGGNAAGAGSGAGKQNPPSSDAEKANAGPEKANADAEKANADAKKDEPGGNAFICIKECTFRLRHFDVGRKIISEPGEMIPPWFEKVE